MEQEHNLHHHTHPPVRHRLHDVVLNLDEMKCQRGTGVCTKVGSYHLGGMSELTLTFISQK